MAQRAYAATLLFLNSDAEYVGGGRQELFTPAEGVFSSASSGTAVHIAFDGGAEHSWTLDFAAPFDSPLEVGAYEMAERWPFQSPARPGLDVSGEGRGCNTLSGRFSVRDVIHGAGGGVQSFAADFEQYCEEGPRKSYRAWIKPLATGVQLHGLVRLTARVRVRGQTVSVVAVSRFVGTRRSGPGPLSQTSPARANAAAMAESRADLEGGSD